MSGLSPVARMESPSRVFKKMVRKAAVTATAARATISLYCPEKGVSASQPFTILKMVSALLRLSSEAPSMTAILTEYRPVLTIIPASRESTPIRVCKNAVRKPEQTPAAMAAGMDSHGWPASATAAPTAAPRVKQPSVDRSQTLSIV